MSHSLSSRDLQRIQEAQRVLLAPLQYDTVEAWQRDVARHLQGVMEADHAYVIMPQGRDVALTGTHLDPAFYDGLRASIDGFQQGRLLFDDPMPLRMHQQRRKGGPGVYHELALADRPTIEAAPSYQEFFFPHGIRYTTGLSVPLPDGEALVCLAFESADAPGYTAEAEPRLELLVPAFEAGIEQWRRLAPARAALPSLIDTLTEAMILFGPDGKERHRNQALRQLLAAEPDAAELLRAAQSLTAPPQTDTILPSPQSLSLSGGRYRLSASRPPLSLFDGHGTLVVIARRSLFPSPIFLQERFDLTPREAEVALLLARGLSNEALADRLFISPHTARHHVQNVLQKIGISSRAAVAHVLLEADQ